MQRMTDILRDVGVTVPRRVGVAGLNMMSVAVWERLHPAFGSAEIVRVDDVLTDLRKRKSAGEIAVLRFAFTLAERAMQAALQSCHVGAYEFEIAAAAEYAMRAAGAEDAAIDSIVALGPENSRPIIGALQPPPGKPEDLICLTFAARYEGYCAPIARPVYVGKPPAHLRKAIDIALEAQRRSVAALRPGATCREVDAAARSLLAEHGYAKYCAYGVGHSVGLQEFEPPYCGPSNAEVLQGSMIMSIDVPMFFSPWGGFRFEDAFLVREQAPSP